MRVLSAGCSGASGTCDSMSKKGAVTKMGTKRKRIPYDRFVREMSVAFTPAEKKDQDVLLGTQKFLTAPVVHDYLVNVGIRKGERIVLEFALAGYTKYRIARITGFTPNTVAVYFRQAGKKIGVTGRERIWGFLASKLLAHH